MKQYKNVDGTYTSPKNGKRYKSEKALRAHLSFRRTEKYHSFVQVNAVKAKCKFCDKEISISNLSRHEGGCYLNPANTKLCKVCNKPVKNYKSSKGTCSRSCANTHFKSGENNGNWKNSVREYATLCYRHHEKKCIVCGESDAVDVHHLDSNRDNNTIDNLIPLCPTHHAYCHRGLYHKIEDKILQYLKEFRKISN
jgi:hypothetical protein